MDYTISQAAKIVNLTPFTIRYYDKEGLLPMVGRSKGGVRVFTKEDIEWLLTINCLKESGLQIKEIKQYIDWYMDGNRTIEQRRQLCYSRKKILEQQQRELQKTLNAIEYKCWFYDEAKRLGSVNKLVANLDSLMPQNIRKIYEESPLAQK